MARSFKLGSYGRNVAVLASGTAMAQAIPLAISPILTRLYAPEDFGVLALYSAIALILTSISTAQYETAITLPADDKDAACLVSLTAKICTVFSLFLLLVVLIFNDLLAQLLGHPEIAAWLFLLPLTVFTSGVYRAYSFWMNRQSAYGQIARQGVQLAIVTGASNIALGLASIAGGQIIGVQIGRIVAAISISRTATKTSETLRIRKKVRDLLPIAKRYSAHPTYFMPARLIEDFALQIPVFMISSIFFISTVGYFALAYRLVSLPIALVANAIGNVYRRQISESYNQQGNFSALYKKTLLTTCIIAIIPFTLLYLLAPSLFGFVFGNEWRIAGDYAQILVVSAFFSFVTTPLDKGAIVVGAKNYILCWNIVRIISFLTVWALAVNLDFQIEQILWSLVVVNACLYLTDACVQFKFSLGKRLD